MKEKEEVQSELWPTEQPVLGAAVAAATAVATAADTPMMAQYLRLKQKYPGCLLFFRLGDFYELFFDDAVLAASVLDIALTKRGKLNGQDIPMCGVPAHACDTYLARLIRRGYRVAVCEQLETPAEAKKRGHKAVVERDVTRIVTPGTLTEDSLLDAKQNNFLAIAMPGGNGLCAIAALDISTGLFFCEQSVLADAQNILARLSPRELIIPENQCHDPDCLEIWQEWRDVLTPLPASRFDYENSQARLLSVFQVETFDAFGTFTTLEQAACGVLLDYVWVTQGGTIPRITPPQRLNISNVMVLDAATRRNLELTQSLSGTKERTLLHTIDETITSAAGRLLFAWISAPLMDVEAIQARLDVVEYFKNNPEIREGLRAYLKQCPDIERSLARLSVRRGGPRDLAVMRDGLTQAVSVRYLFDDYSSLPKLLKNIVNNLGYHQLLIDHLTNVLKERLPLQARDGNFIASGYSPELDELRLLQTQGQSYVTSLQEQYISETGIISLKVKQNNILGYYIEVGTAHASRVPPAFVHRQTLASMVRFTTPTLVGLEQKISHASEKALAIEMEIYQKLSEEILESGDTIGQTAQALAQLDVLVAFAELAEKRKYTRPIVDNSTNFIIHQGRHPVVEVHCRKDFMPNDCEITDERRLWLLTGPNMAGKSTFLRQNALIAILAQIGCYVPATSAHIGVVDRLFSRVGASDDLASGRSTFMVEMVETAAILNQAGPQSLVILDEIGRGTSTFDGVSIAWATVEYLYTVNRTRGLFATHYHELTALASQLPNLACYTIAVQEWQGKIVFLHQLVPGMANRSYGIHVGQLAGLPEPVVDRANEILKHLEEQSLQLTAIPRAAA